MVRADILDPLTEQVLDSCTGADEEGFCPRLDEQGHVACAGHVLDAQAPEVRWALRMSVAENAGKCPLRGFVPTSR
jgi:hypothetical protein